MNELSTEQIKALQSLIDLNGHKLELETINAAISIAVAGHMDVAIDMLSPQEEMVSMEQQLADVMLAERIARSNGGEVH